MHKFLRFFLGLLTGLDCREGSCQIGPIRSSIRLGILSPFLFNLELVLEHDFFTSERDDRRILLDPLLDRDFQFLLCDLQLRDRTAFSSRI